MVHKKIIWLGLSMCISIGYAQDTLRMEPAKYIAGNTIYDLSNRQLLNVSALKPSYYTDNYTRVQVGYTSLTKQKYDWQEGSGNKNLNFYSETYQHLSNGLTVWGDAHFKSIKQQNVSYNENLDYNKVYPYFVADTVGGDLKQESYHFGGGLAKSWSKWTLAGEGYLTANQGYRQVDPRPLNKSTDIELQGAVSRSIGGEYILSAAVDYEYYKQTSRLYFVSELGRPLILNMNGPAVYNNLLTGMGGSSSSALGYYVNNTLAATLILKPRQSGFYAKGKVMQRTGEKFSNHTNESINFWTDEQLGIDAGYMHQQGSWYWRAIASWQVRRMMGADGLFTTETSSSSGGYNKIADRSSYRYFSDRYAANFEVGDIAKWQAQLQVAYHKEQEQYISPYRNMEWSPLDISFSAQYFIKGKKNHFTPSIQVAKRSINNQDYSFSNVNFESGLGQLLMNNWEYRLVKPIFAQAQLLYLINLNNGMSPFVKINAGYATEVEMKKFELHLGINF